MGEHLQVPSIDIAKLKILLNKAQIFAGLISSITSKIQAENYFENSIGQSTNEFVMAGKVFEYLDFYDAYKNCAREVQRISTAYKNHAKDLESIVIELERNAVS